MNEDLEPKKITEKVVEKFLKTTGFIFEMEVSEILKKNGYTVRVNQFFLDLEESKKREIDIIAEKVINKIKFVLVIECKQSIKDSWIFICSEKKPLRYYYAVKHLPKVFDLAKSKVFNNTHIMDRSIPIAQNYIAMDKYQNKKTDSIRIEELLWKLPKALIGAASDYSGDVGEKIIYLPVAMFSDQFFTARYENLLKVEERNIVQYQVDFESKFYKKLKTNRLLGQSEVNESLYSLDDVGANVFTINKILDIAEKFSSKFLIDFVNKKGLEDYLKIVEKEINNISVKKWSHNLTVKPPKPPKPHKV